MSSLSLENVAEAEAWERLPQEEKDALALTWEQRQYSRRQLELLRKKQDVKRVREDFLAWREKRSKAGT